MEPTVNYLQIWTNIFWVFIIEMKCRKYVNFICLIVRIRLLESHTIEKDLESIEGIWEMPEMHAL